MAEFNPYAAPEAEVIQGRATGIDEGRGVWVDGTILVMAKAAHLPHRCIKCDAPATSWVARRFMWHPIGYYLFAMLGLIPYLIIALIVRDTMKLAIPLCESHRKARAKAFGINWIVGLVGLAICFAPAIGPDLGFLIAVGVSMIFGSLIFAAIKASILVPKRIDKTHAWFKQAGPDFLASLPSLPAPAVEL